MNEIRETLIRLRSDAIERDLKDLAICYGWSVIRIGCELIDAQMRELGIKSNDERVPNDE